MLCKIGGRAWTAVALEVAGRGADHARGVRDLARDQCRVGELSHTDGHIGALFDQIDNTVCEGEFDPYIGIARQEIRQGRNELVRAESASIDTQAPARRTARTSHFGFEFFDIGKELARTRKVKLAFRAECKATRGAMKQPDTEPFFQPADQL
jgi:hypothetical protein